MQFNLSIPLSESFFLVSMLINYSVSQHFIRIGYIKQTTLTTGMQGIIVVQFSLLFTLCLTDLSFICLCR